MTEPTGAEHLEGEFFALRKYMWEGECSLAQGKKLLDKYHPADLAKFIHYLNTLERQEFVEKYYTILNAECLTYVDEEVRIPLLDALDPGIVAFFLSRLESDDVISLIENCADEHREAVLQYLDQEERLLIRTSLTYPEESAGRLMQREVFGILAHRTVREALKILSHVDLPKGTSDIFLVDHRNRLVGVVPLTHLFRHGKDTVLLEMSADAYHKISVHVNTDEVVRQFRQYDLVTAPVLDEQGYLVGMITIDDVMDLASDTAEENILSLGGVHSDDFYAPILSTSLSRLPWLFLTLVNALLASSVVAQFSDILQRKISLAIFMPIVASMGGNSGMQVLTVTVRAIATEELVSWNTSRAIMKELGVALMNGCVLGSILAILGYIWLGDIGLCLVMMLAVTVNILWSCLMGTILPILSHRWGRDPALSTGPLLATMTDIFGFALFLGLASLWL